MKRTLLVNGILLTLMAQGHLVAQQFVGGLAQPVFSTAAASIVTHNVWVRVPGIDLDRDGFDDRVRVQIRRPIATESGVKLPVVMTASPYSGGTLPYHTYDIFGPLYEPIDLDPFGHDLRPDPQWPVAPPPVNPLLPFYDGTQGSIPNITASGYQTYFLARGFIFAYAQNIGTGKSTGCPTIGGVEENLAMKAVIDWFNGVGQAYDASGNAVTAYWTTGATAMIGTSYDGTLPINAAVTGVNGLKAIVPVAGVSSYYDHRRSHGAVSVIGDSDSLMVNTLSRMYPERCHYLRDQHAVATDRTTGDFNAFWNERNMVKDVANITAAVLISHGLNDPNVKMRHAYRLWQALKANGVASKIWLNTGGHGDNADSGASQAMWREELNRFWSQYLFGQTNNWTSGARAKVQRSASTWTDYATWPVPEARTTTLSLIASVNNAIGELYLGTPAVAKPPMTLEQKVADEVAHAQDPDTGTYELIVDNSIINATTHVAALQSPHRLIYKTAPLTAPVHVSGLPTISLKLKFSKAAAVVSAMLVDYRSNGTRMIVSRGWGDPQNRHSIWETYAIQPGRPYDFEFEFQPHDYIFPAGSQIGLVLMGGDWEGEPPLVFTMRPPPGTEISIDSPNVKLHLPIVGGANSFAAGVPCSDETCVPPQAPSALAAKVAAPASVALSWTDNADSEDGFEVERSSNGQSYGLIATLGPNITSFADGSGPVTAPRYYRVRAFNNSRGDSADSNVAITGDLDGNNSVDCGDIAVVRASFGKRTGQPGFDPRADVNGNGVVDVTDLALVSRMVPPGTVCQ